MNSILEHLDKYLLSLVAAFWCTMSLIDSCLSFEQLSTREGAECEVFGMAPVRWWPSPEADGGLLPNTSQIWSTETVSLLHIEGVFGWSTDALDLQGIRRFTVTWSEKKCVSLAIPDTAAAPEGALSSADGCFSFKPDGWTDGCGLSAAAAVVSDAMRGLWRSCWNYLSRESIISEFKTHSI